MNEAACEKTKPSIGFIGLGAMGGAMARNLARNGYDVFGFDIVEEKIEECAADGVKAASNVRDAVEKGRIVMASLRSSAVFVEVAEQRLLPAARAGQIFLDMGTTEACETRRLEKAFREKGATLLDCPVSGGPGGSAAGTLAIFAGGDAKAFEAVKPILHTLGEPEHVVHCGPSGAGQVVKGVNQLAMGLPVAGYLEAIAYGVRGGVDPAAILQAVGGPSGFRAQFAAVCKRIVKGEGESADIKFAEFPYFLREAGLQGFEMPVTQALFDFMNEAPWDALDNMRRNTVPYWRELMKRSISPRDKKEELRPKPIER